MTAKIVHNGTVHTGSRVDTVARRVWGRKVEVRLSADPNNRVGDDGHQAQITRTDKFGTHVLAQVVVYGNLSWIGEEQS